MRAGGSWLRWATMFSRSPAKRVHRGLKAQLLRVFFCHGDGFGREQAGVESIPSGTHNGHGALPGLDHDLRPGADAGHQAGKVACGLGLGDANCSHALMILQLQISSTDCLYPPAIAPMISSGSRPARPLPAAARRAASCDQSSSQAKKRRNAPALAGVVVANGSAQHGIAGLERIEHGAQRDRRGDFELHFAPDLRQVAQMIRQGHANRASAPPCALVHPSLQRLHLDGEHRRQVAHNRRPGVAGIGRAYTWPPVVPK